MYRFVGIVAIFCGWLSIPIGALAGLFVSGFFDTGVVDGAGAPMAVYGFSAMMVFWLYAGVTVVSAIPMVLAAVAVDPRGPLQIAATAMGTLGVVLLPSELGRAFGLPIVAGAAGLWVGADLVSRGGSAPAPVAAEVAGGPAWARETGASAASVTSAGGAEAGDDEAGDDEAGGGPGRDATAVATAAVQFTPLHGAADPAAGAPETRRHPDRSPSPAQPIPRRVCPWCSTEVPAGGADCPNCGAALTQAAAEQVAIPGLTEVPPALKQYVEDARSRGRRKSLLNMIFGDSEIPTALNAPPPSDIEALRPPSPELKAEMARLDAEIAAGAAEPASVEPGPPGAEPGT